MPNKVARHARNRCPSDPRRSPNSTGTKRIRVPTMARSRSELAMTKRIVKTLDAMGGHVRPSRLVRSLRFRMHLSASRSVSCTRRSTPATNHMPIMFINFQMLTFVNPSRCDLCLLPSAVTLLAAESLSRVLPPSHHLPDRGVS